MGYRGGIYALLGFIALDIVFTIVRPTSVDLHGDSETISYVLLSVHIGVVFAQALALLFMMGSTIWFSAGLLYELLTTAYFTAPVWLLRLFFVQMPWTYRYHIKFLGDAGERITSDRGYVALFVLENLVAVVSSGCLFYTAARLSEKRMYAPYHKDREMLDHGALQAAAVAVNGGKMMSSGGSMVPASSSTFGPANSGMGGAIRGGGLGFVMPASLVPPGSVAGAYGPHAGV
jgi:hypothetical protein